MAKEEEPKFHELVERKLDWDKVEAGGIEAVIAILKCCELTFHDDGDPKFAPVRPYCREE